MGPWKDGGVAIGITGSYEALTPVIEEYRGDTSRIFFPFPTELRDRANVPEGTHVIMMMFDRAGLARAAAKALASPAVGGAIGGAR
jgi:hypothetical protein